MYKYLFTWSTYPVGITETKDTFDSKSELLEPKKENSPTCTNFLIFDNDPNLTSNFQIHKNVGGNFYFVYKYIYKF